MHIGLENGRLHFICALYLLVVKNNLLKIKKILFFLLRYSTVLLFLSPLKIKCIKF